jgi:hypothetical protein
MGWLIYANDELKMYEEDFEANFKVYARICTYLEELS